VPVVHRPESPADAPDIVEEFHDTEGTESIQAPQEEATQATENAPPDVMILGSEADVFSNPPPLPDEESERGYDEGDDEEDESAASQVDPEQKKKKRRRISPCVILSEATERMLGEWLEEEVPFIYNKGLGEHKDTHKIAKLFEEKAATLDPPITGPELKQWFESNRTRYGRLSKEKSGQGSRRYTEREKWILQLFRFLKPHIVRQRKPRTYGISTVSFSAYL